MRRHGLTPPLTLTPPLGPPAAQPYNPRRHLHSAPSKTLAIITPGLLGPDYFREIAAVLQSTPPGTPPNAVAIGEIMRRHGLTPAP